MQPQGAKKDVESFLSERTDNSAKTDRLDYR